MDGLGDGLEVEGGLFDPAGEGLARELDSVALMVDLLLPVEWKVIAIFGDDDLGKESGRGKAAFDEALG